MLRQSSSNQFKNNATNKSETFDYDSLRQQQNQNLKFQSIEQGTNANSIQSNQLKQRSNNSINNGNLYNKYSAFDQNLVPLSKQSAMINNRLRPKPKPLCENNFNKNRRQLPNLSFHQNKLNNSNYANNKTDTISILNTNKKRSLCQTEFKFEDEISIRRDLDSNEDCNMSSSIKDTTLMTDDDYLGSATKTVSMASSISQQEEQNSRMFGSSDKMEIGSSPLIAINKYNLNASLNNHSINNSMLNSSTNFEIPLCDILDYNDDLCAVEYTNDIMEHLFKIEKFRKPMLNYMELIQKDISSRMRTILIDQLIEVHEKFRLRTETLFLAINYLDRFLSSYNVVRSKFQLVGCCALLLASKIEEIQPPQLRDFVYVSDKAFDLEDLKKMEIQMIQVLDYNLSIPSQFRFLQRFLRISCSTCYKNAVNAAQNSLNNFDSNQSFQTSYFKRQHLETQSSNTNILNTSHCSSAESPSLIRNESNMQADSNCNRVYYLSLFILQLCLVEYRMIKYLPSEMAASTTFIANRILDSNFIQSDQLIQHTKYTLNEIANCIDDIQNLLLNPNKNEKAVRKKFRRCEYGGVACIFDNVESEHEQK